MALLVDQLQWSQPLVPAIDDPAWEGEVRGLMGGIMPGSFRYVASSPWIRNTYLDAVRTPMTSLAPSEMELAGLVTSQENACRYCYGSARVRMKMIGFTDEMIDRIERNVQLVEAEPRERELVQFCRNLARSKPRPARQAREKMREVGFSAMQTAELAYMVAMVGFCNRVSTLLAVPPEVEMEAMGPKMKGMWSKLSAWLPGKQAPRSNIPAPTHPAPTFKGPFGRHRARARGIARGGDGRSDPEPRVFLRRAAAANARPHLRRHRPDARVQDSARPTPPSCSKPRGSRAASWARCSTRWRHRG